MIEKIKSISKVEWLAVALIVIGVAIMIPKAMGMVEFYKESRYAAEHADMQARAAETRAHRFSLSATGRARRDGPARAGHRCRRCGDRR